MSVCVFMHVPVSAREVGCVDMCICGGGQRSTLSIVPQELAVFVLLLFEAGSLTGI